MIKIFAPTLPYASLEAKAQMQVKWMLGEHALVYKKGKKWKK